MRVTQHRGRGAAVVAVGHVGARFLRHERAQPADEQELLLHRRLALLRRHAQRLLDLLHEHVVRINAADVFHGCDPALAAGQRQAK